MNVVDTVWIPDDFSFNTGTMMLTQWFSEKIFPCYRKTASLYRDIENPIIYHSDGNLTSVINTIIEIGFNAFHSIEPESMDVYELRKYVQDRFYLLGNISMNTLSIGTKPEIRYLVHDRVIRLGYQGSNYVGSSNLVPNYVPIENYITTIQTNVDSGAIYEKDIYPQ